jgi:hypothetical protein
MRKITIFLIWLILISSGCTSQSAFVPTQQSKDNLPVIVHIKTRNEIVTIFSGQTEPLYNVTTKEGKVLGQYLSDKELLENLPDIYYLLKTSYTDDLDNIVIWAN